MIMEILNFVFALIITVGAGYFVYMSNVLVSEKKARYRAGTHDYYDNPIEDVDDTKV
jgi:hypothetical protein